MSRDFCITTSAIWRLVGYAIFVIKIVVPIIIIVLGTIDLVKCVTSGKDEEIKSSFQKLLKKVIIGILIFLVPTITRTVFKLIKEASESMKYAETCIICLTGPTSKTCGTAVTTAAEYRKTRNEELYNKYYEDLNGDKDEPVVIGGKSGGDPAPDDPDNPDNPTPSDPTPSDPTDPYPIDLDPTLPAGVNKFTFTASSGTTYNYWVVTPNNVHAGMPMIVFLHGGGNDISAKDYYTPDQMFNNLVTVDHPYVDVKNIYGSNFPFILLIPHNYYSWYGNGYLELYELITQVSDIYYVDTNRISITGVSNGGVGAWKFIDNYPYLPASVYIVSGPQSVANLHPENFKNLYIKGISETNNGYYSVMEANCQTINALGGSGSCEITPRSDMTHNTILSVAYPKEIFEWMISKSR